MSIAFYNGPGALPQAFRADLPLSGQAWTPAGSPRLSTPRHKLSLWLARSENTRAGLVVRDFFHEFSWTVGWTASAPPVGSFCLVAHGGGRCVRCARPQRSGSSRPELDRFDWQKLRRAARLRDGNSCVRCGATERLSVHHAVERSNVLEDLVTLCSRCHAREHAQKRPARKAYFLRGNRATPTRPTMTTIHSSR
jgi:hypothetical protein